MIPSSSFSVQPFSHRCNASRSPPPSRAPTHRDTCASRKITAEVHREVGEDAAGRRDVSVLGLPNWSLSLPVSGSPSLPFSESLWPSRLHPLISAPSPHLLIFFALGSILLLTKHVIVCILGTMKTPPPRPGAFRSGPACLPRTSVPSGLRQPSLVPYRPNRLLNSLSPDS